MRARLDTVEPRSGGADVTVTLTFERAGGDQPVCVAEFFIRLQAKAKSSCTGEKDRAAAA